MQELKHALWKEIENNIKSYIVICAVFIASVCAALAMHTDEIAKEEVRLYITDVLSGLSHYGSNGADIFFAAFKMYLPFATWMLLSSFTILGTPIALICIFMEGFSHGTVICTISTVFGAKAFLLFLCAILPHALFTVPGCLMYCCHAMKHSHQLFSGKREYKKDLFLPLVHATLFLTSVCIGALVQAYIEPVFLTAISKYFI